MKCFRCTMIMITLFFALLFSRPVTAMAEEDTSEETALPVYTVRFSGAGLYVYEDASMTVPIAVLQDQTPVRILQGPVDFLVRIRIDGVGLEGYTDMRYLKRAGAVVEDYDVYTYEEMVDDIMQLQSRYPELLRVDTTGASADGRDLYALTLGDGNAPQHILVHAGIHAREYSNPLLVMEQLEYCLEHYDSGSYLGMNFRDLFTNAAVHIIPMVNPDGIAISQFGESALRSPELVELVRACYLCDVAAGRTKRSYEAYLTRWKANARGVDLNKNFPFGFGVKMRTAIPSYEGYPGLTPFSEPETASLGALTLQYQPSVIISYHSMGEVVYWNTAESKYTDLNRGFSAYMLSLVPYKRMGSGSATGSYLDWIYSGETPVRSVTFETGNVECPLPAGQYPRIWVQHSSVLPAAAWYACSGL